MASAVISQGVLSAAGLGTFSWRGVAAAGAASWAGSQLNGIDGLSADQTKMLTGMAGNAAGQLVTSGKIDPTQVFQATLNSGLESQFNDNSRADMAKIQPQGSSTIGANDRTAELLDALNQEQPVPRAEISRKGAIDPILASKAAFGDGWNPLLAPAMSKTALAAMKATGYSELNGTDARLARIKAVTFDEDRKQRNELIESKKPEFLQLWEERKVQEKLAVKFESQAAEELRQEKLFKQGEKVKSMRAALPNYGDDMMRRMVSNYDGSPVSASEIPFRALILPAAFGTSVVHGWINLLTRPADSFNLWKTELDYNINSGNYLAAGVQVATLAGNVVPALAEVKAFKAFKFESIAETFVDKTLARAELVKPSDRLSYAVKNIPSDLVADSRGVYGYVPKDGTQFSQPKWSVDWTNSQQVANAREVRLEYHQGLADETAWVAKMRADGVADESIARQIVDLRNQTRMSKYSTEQLSMLYERNKVTYGNPHGPTYESLLEKYGNPQDVIASGTRSNLTMDILTGIAKVQP
ncbi:hypothetical protein IGB42_02341 [Andreprevotia sp. IGB-42]|nr:hypothetical protein IGB42_02341 [Andreprevotia sp. IGB-42]